METFEVTQVIMTVGSTYEVRVPPDTLVAMTVKGSLMSPTPKFQLVGADGAELATLTGNFIKTKFQIRGAAKEELGALQFPAIAFKKTLVMTVGGRGFTADGGIMGGMFRCIDNAGKVGIEIANKGGFHDRFHVMLHDGIAKEVGILAAVAIHSRFFELSMKDLKILTLNIWNRLGPWDERLRAIRDTMGRESPDVVGLQEVITTPHGDALHQAKAIAMGLGYEVAFGASHGEGFSFGNAVLSRWPIRTSAHFALPTGEGAEPRSLLFAELESPVGVLPVFVTHLAWRYNEGAVRQAQVVAVAEKVLELAPHTGLPALLMGDFNAEPTSDEVRYLKGLTRLGRERCVYFADAFEMAGDGSRGATFSKRNPFAEPLREPDRRIDYIFVQRRNDDVRGEPISARVCFDEPVEGTYPTDHFGVTATVRY